MDFRINLYSRSELNLFKPSGPQFVSLFSQKTKTIIMDYCEGGFDSNEKYYLDEYNIKIGDQPYIKLDGYLLWNKIFPEIKSTNILQVYNLLDRKHGGN